MPTDKTKHNEESKKEREMYEYGDEQISAGSSMPVELRSGRRRTILSFRERVHTSTTRFLDNERDPLINKSNGINFDDLPSKIDDIGEIGEFGDNNADLRFQQKIKSKMLDNTIHR